MVQVRAKEKQRAMTTSKNDRILLAHGGGGQLTDELVRNLILPSFDNDVLARTESCIGVGVLYDGQLRGKAFVL